MFGPVFWNELRLAGRQNRLHLFRWGVGLLLAVELLLLLPSPLLDLATQAASLRFLGLQQLVIVVLVTPLFTASAFTEERSRGTLALLLATYLTPWQIVLDKFLARVGQLLLLVLTCLPVLAVAAAFSDIAPGELLTAALDLFGPLLTLAAVGLLMSVVCRTAPAAALVTYLLLTAVVLMLVGVQSLPPGTLPAVAPAIRFAVYTCTVIVCLLLAGWRLPRVCFPVEKRSARHEALPETAEASSLQERPMLWKETYCAGWLRRLLAVRATPFVGWFIVSGLAVGFLLRLVPNGEVWWVALAAGVCVLGSTLAGVQGALTITGERDRQTWDMLLVAPLDEDVIIGDKVTATLTGAMLVLGTIAIPLVIVAVFSSAACLIAVVYLMVAALPLAWLLAPLGVVVAVRCSGTVRAVVLTVLLGLVHIAVVLGAPVAVFLGGWALRANRGGFTATEVAVHAISSSVIPWLGVWVALYLLRRHYVQMAETCLEEQRYPATPDAWRRTQLERAAPGSVPVRRSGFVGRGRLYDDTLP